MYSRWLRNSFIYLLILVAVIAIVFSVFNPGGGPQTKPFGFVTGQVKSGNVGQIDVSGDSLTVHMKDNTTYHSRKESGTSLESELKDAGIDPNSSNYPLVNVKEPSQ